MSKRVLVTALMMLSGVWMTGSAEAGSYYVGGHLGMVFIEDADLSVSGYGKFGSLSFDDGYGLGLALGNNLGDGLRSELEVFYRENDVDRGKVEVPEVDLYGSGPVSGDISSWGAMANFYFDFEIKSPFRPFLGAGIGIANVDLDVESISDDEWVLAYQGMAGCSYLVSKDLSVDLQYRYFATEDPELKVDGGTIDYEYRTHNVTLGLRYYF